MKKLLLILIILSAGIFLFGQNNTISSAVLFAAKNNAGVACYRIPAIVTAPNGDLIAAADERVPSCGDLKWNNDINIVIRRSEDKGKTWEPIERIIDYPLGQSASDPSFIVDNVTSEIFMFFNYMDLVQEKDVYYLKLIRSADNGKTWSAPQDITSQITKSEWQKDFKFITSGSGIQTSKGKLIHTLVNLQKGLFIFGSDDHGKSWHLMETPIKPADESKIVQLSDGSWMVNSRVNGLGYRYVHQSNDEGKSWSSKIDSSLVDPGCNASILRYSSTKGTTQENMLLFSNANNTSERVNLSIRISYDDGKTWTAGKTIYDGSSAYSSMTILSNGDIGLLFEKDNYQEIAFVIVPMQWITN
ncbi:MAG: exo-alpha-sialidase [Bacteroidales bacterium]|nr:exo-alpha-sialidase [Bacteroidales bacterium]